MKALLISFIIFVSVSLFAAGNGIFDGFMDYDGNGGIYSGDIAPEGGSSSDKMADIISLEGYSVRYEDGVMNIYLSIKVPEGASYAVVNSSVNGGMWSEAASSIIIPQEDRNRYMQIISFSLHEEYLIDGDAVSYSVSFFSDPSRSNIIIMSEMISFEY